MDSEDTGLVLFLIFLFLCGTFGLYCLYKSATSDGRVTFCYVTTYAPAGMPMMYQAWGHREWRSDQHLSTKSTFEEAVQDATLLRCPVATGKTP